MINIRHLLEKGKIIVPMVGIGSVWEVITLVSTFCLVFVLLIGCGELNLDDPKVREKILAKAINEDSLQTRRVSSGEELFYAPNQEKPYAGWVKSGRELYQMQNGNPNGFYISWYSNSQNSEKGTLKNSEKEGVWTQWHENGQKSGRGSYKDNKRDGVWVFYYENGQKSLEGTYKSGIYDGLWTEYLENGQKSSEISYKADKKDGSYVTWYRNGQTEEEGAYIHDAKDGLWTY